MSLKAKIDERLELLNQKAKRSLGQNFLIDQKVVDTIVGRVADSVGRVVDGDVNIKESSQEEEEVSLKLQWIEIGPGLGSLTDSLRPYLLKVIELDSAFAEFWRSQDLDVVEMDALKFDWSSIEKPVGLVSNLPYQISSRIVVEMSINSVPAIMVLMFQKEVADRMISKKMSSSYGFLSVIAQSFWTIEKVIFVSPNCFSPRPKVDSQVLEFKAKNSKIKNRAKYVEFVKSCFLERRKKISNKAKKLKLLEEFKEFFEANKLSLDMRAEELTPENFENLFLYCEQKGRI